MEKSGMRQRDVTDDGAKLAPHASLFPSMLTIIRRRGESGNWPFSTLCGFAAWVLSLAQYYRYPSGLIVVK